MKSTFMACLVVSLCLGLATAQDLGTSRELPLKTTAVATYEVPAEPRQGGDTIEDAVVISGLPYSTVGTTVGYVNDYDEVCPYGGNITPDVVYSFTPDSDVQVDVDLCGSGYDTKTYIYNGDLYHLIACNDDYGGQSGPYVLDVSEYEPCFLPCPDDAMPEGEPPLGYGYEDAYNGGCNSPEFGIPFQTIDWTNDEDGLPPYDGNAWLCGKSGWFFTTDGAAKRDTDWFSLFALETGEMEFTVESEYPCYIFKLAPLDCENVAVELQATARCELPATLSFPVVAGEEIWLWIGPTSFVGPVTEFTYFMTVSNNTFDTVPVEEMSWGRVKSLYR